MKFLQIFNKTTSYKKFNYAPRFYNPEEEERKERIGRIEREFNAEKAAAEATESAPKDGPDSGYRTRIRGGFNRARQANGSVPAGTNSSPILLRFTILLVLTVGFIGYLQYGNVALYGIGVILIPLILFFKFLVKFRK